MTDWIKCTDESGGPVFMNLATAVSMHWNEKDKCTLITYLGDGGDAWRVQETPEAILPAARGG